MCGLEFALRSGAPAGLSTATVGQGKCLECRLGPRGQGPEAVALMFCRTRRTKNHRASAGKRRFLCAMHMEDITLETGIPMHKINAYVDES